MKPRQLAILAGVAIAVGAGAFLTTRKGSGARLATVAAPIQEAVFFKGVNPADVHQIIIESGGERIVLHRTDEKRWEVETPRGRRRANLGKGEALFARRGLEEEIKANMRGRRVAELRESHRKFGVEEGSAPKVTFLSKEGTELEALVIGAAAEQAPMTSYVRRPKEDAVYLVNADLSDNFSGKAKDWRERRLHPDAQAEKVVQLRYDDAVTTKSYELTPSSSNAGEWAITWEGGTQLCRPGFGRAAALGATGIRVLDYLTEEEAKKDFGPELGKFVFSLRDDPTSYTVQLYTGFVRGNNTEPTMIAVDSVTGDPAFVLDPAAVRRLPSDFVAPSPTPTPTPLPTPEPPVSEQMDDGSGADGEVSGPMPTLVPEGS
jgi:hypothetical protein